MKRVVLVYESGRVVYEAGTLADESGFVPA